MISPAKTIQLRFKSPEASVNTPASQSLLINRTGSDNGSFQFGLFLEYTGSFTSGSYSGSIVDPYYQYGTLKFVSGSVSASTYLPFFDGGWWSVMVTQEGSGPYTYTLYTKNKLYSGDDGNTIGFQASSSLTDSGSWYAIGSTQIPGSGSATLNGQTYVPATASFQEVRYYSTALSESVFDDYVMNANSIEGNSSSYNELLFRASLGGELYTGSTSVHPSVTGSTSIPSFFDNTSTFSYTGSYNFISNTEVNFYDQVPAGIRNAVSNKVRIENSTLYGTVLSNLNTLQQNYPASQSYTRDINYLEVGYSPQNEINEDIMDSLGYFNIGDYIGDPRQISSSAFIYPALEELKKDYFKKYNKSYNYQDYFRLIKFYDNSLYKLLKDFIPARTAAATGAIVKQHLLERNRQRPAQLSWTRPEYSASLLSVARDYESGSIGVFDGGPAGSVNDWINISQSYTASVLGPEGLVTYIESSEYEFYNGAYSGSRIECQLSESINTTPLLNNVSSSRLSIKYEDVDYSSNALNPVNLALIQSGSAQKAAVQDSNYDPKSAFFELRYSGTKYTSQNYNVFTEGDAQKDPAIDLYTDWLAYYDWIGGSNPQLPGGGNFHIITLLNARTKEVKTLSTKNENLGLVESMFRQGDSPTQIVTTFSSTDSTNEIEVETGGALYQTIIVQESSNASPNTATFSAYYGTSNASPVFVGFFANAGVSTLMDTGSIYKPFLFPLVTGSDPNLGTVREIGGSGLAFFNRITGQTTQDTTPYEQTLLPLQVNDFIRFGDTGSSSSSSLDGSFEALGLYRIKELNIAPTASESSSLTIVPVLNADTQQVTTWGFGETNQTYRVFRRVPNETFVVVKNIPQNLGAGLLVPENFNPDLDPISSAREAGLI